MIFAKARYGAAILLLFSAPANADEKLSIELANGSDDEIVVREQLEGFLLQYELEPYLFTKRVRVDRTQVPHSHPVLTLHTRHANEDDLQLSTFLHEQLHWHLSERAAETDAAIEELRQAYPRVPAGFPEGARDTNSTYLHLLVNRLEYHALSGLVGKQRADEAFAFWRNDHYTWIYQTVFEDGPAIDALLARHGLTGRAEKPAE